MAKGAAVPKSEVAPKKRSPGTVRSIRVPVEVDQEIVAACFRLGHEFNYSRFALEAFDALLDRYRRRYNSGRPFTPLPPGVRLKTGRPLNPPKR